MVELNDFNTDVSLAFADRRLNSVSSNIFNMSKLINPVPPERCVLLHIGVGP